MQKSSALAAEVSGQASALGKRHCVLFADLVNPTSNGIYQNIGYRVVADALHPAFEPLSV